MKKGKLIFALALTAFLLIGAIGMGKLLISLMLGGAERFGDMGDMSYDVVEETLPWEDDQEQATPKLGVDQDYDAPDDPDATEAPKEEMKEVPVDQTPEELDALN